MEKQYAKAIDELVHKKGSNSEKLVANLIAHLKETGRIKLLPGIVRELRILEAKRAKLAPSVEVASEKEAHAAITAAAKEGIEVKKAVVNHALIKGWRARRGGTLIDRSSKQALLDIYRKVTN